jgi:hypothetical protein
MKVSYYGPINVKRNTLQNLVVTLTRHPGFIQPVIDEEMSMVHWWADTDRVN